MTDIVVRAATDDDVPALNAIYNEYIVDSHVSFDTEPWSDDARRTWLHGRTDDGYPVLVALVKDTVIGCAWSGPWRDKAAYRSSVETTVVLTEGTAGQGMGRRLYQELLHRLAAAGFHTAIAIIALPNDASVAFHANLGYREVGTLEEVGKKNNQLYATTIMQKIL